MNLLSEDEIKPRSGLSFAPMIDFLFLMLALFATLAISRATIFDSDIDLVTVSPAANAASFPKDEIHQVNLSIDAEGTYHWLADLNQYRMENLDEVRKELIRQYEMGLYPQDKLKTEVLLHIDQKARWSRIAELIFAIREIGFQARPVFEPQSS